MKSIIGYIKEDLSPAELADLIEQGVYKKDEFGRFRSTTSGIPLKSLSTLIETCNDNGMDLSELVAMLESGDVSGITLPTIAILGENRTPTNLDTAIITLSNTYIPDHPNIQKLSKTVGTHTKINPSLYYNKLTDRIDQAVSGYPTWKKTQQQVRQTVEIPDWLSSLGIEGRDEQAIAKRTLADHYPADFPRQK